MAHRLLPSLAFNHSAWSGRIPQCVLGLGLSVGLCARQYGQAAQWCPHYKWVTALLTCRSCWTLGLAVHVMLALWMVRGGEHPLKLS